LKINLVGVFIMNFIVTKKNADIKLLSNFGEIIFQNSDILIKSDKVLYRWEGEGGKLCFIIGIIDAIRLADGTLKSQFNVGDISELLYRIENLNRLEGRFIYLQIDKDSFCQIWTDKFGRVDLYWYEEDGFVAISSGLDSLYRINPKVFQMPDNVGLAHSLIVFGCRPAKQHTIFKGVRRLGIDQGIILSQGKIKILSRKFIPKKISPDYTTNDMHRYSDALIEAIKGRASHDGNIVYLSSGWDSTSILGILVHLFGNRKVRAIIGRMRFSERSGIINQFEIDRAKAVADYYKVKLDIVEFDYRYDADKLLEKNISLFRDQQYATLTGLGHSLLAEAAAKSSNGNEVIFAGEMSDGAHNLGFSQFATIFHNASQHFREYSDKMASYLFGPTFLNQLATGKYKDDPVWNLFQSKYQGYKFDKIDQSKAGISRQLLSSFFLRGARVPLYSVDNSKLLTSQGAKIYIEESESIYIKNIENEVDAENLYAYYLHLYNSFHWQCSTVPTLETTAENMGLRCVMPFHDSSVIDFLSGMPEDWGRGLDLNPTKYPLKWTLRNKIDYPFHLQVGPHSYTYDIDPGFTLIGEVLYASSFAPLYKEALMKSKFVDSLSEEYFDVIYIRGLVKKYLLGEEIRGQEQSDLAVIANHSLIGTVADNY